MGDTYWYIVSIMNSISAEGVDFRVYERILQHQLTTNYETMTKLYDRMICRAGFVVLRNNVADHDDNVQHDVQHDAQYDVLFVKQSRSGFDGFPKGISDDCDESAIATAIRELGEETGISPVDMIDISPVVWAVPRKDFHEVCFFFVCLVGNVDVRVDGDEILGFQWIPMEKIVINQQMAFVTQSMISDLRLVDMRGIFTCDQ